MTRLCTICTHPESAAIDRALFAREPNRRVATQFGVSEGAIRRHKAEHLRDKLSQAAEARDADEAVDLLVEMHALRRKAMDLLTKAEKAGQYRVALQGIREARGCLELLAEMQGELDRRATVNVLVTGEWVTVRSALMAALVPYPDARLAVVESLAALESGA